MVVDDETSTQVTVMAPVVSAPRKRKRKDKSEAATVQVNCSIPSKITVITVPTESLQHQGHQQSQDTQESLSNSSTAHGTGHYDYLSCPVDAINVIRGSDLPIESYLTRGSVNNSQETPPSSPDSHATVLNVSIDVDR